MPPEEKAYEKMNTIHVVVAGANGRMGQEVVRLIARTEGISLVGATSRSQVGRDVGEVAGVGKMNVLFDDSLEKALLRERPDVLVDFTVPHTVRENIELALDLGVRPVVGTTGLTEQDVEELTEQARDKSLGAVIAPNFAIGAVLMMMFAAEAAKYLPDVEIIEMHHDQKLDAPSGTALKTAQLISSQRKEKKQGHPEEKELLEGARGGYVDGFRVHSVRLPGLVAHQEVLFGGPGQLLTLRHDSINRESFMPGVQLAIKKVMELDHLVYGLENLLDK